MKGSNQVQRIYLLVASNAVETPQTEVNTSWKDFLSFELRSASAHCGAHTFIAIALCTKRVVFGYCYKIWILVKRGEPAHTSSRLTSI